MSRGRYKSDERRQDRISKPIADGGLDRSSAEVTVTVVERRVKHLQSPPSSTTSSDGKERRKTDWHGTKGLFLTPKHFYDAYLKVRKNRGSAGVDGQCLEDFDDQAARELYRLWNLVSSGTYFPSAVKEVGIPKSNGKTRYLGIPTVGDRTVQQVVKTILEPRLEAIFCAESYGYRPGKTAHEALERVRQNCQQYWWTIDMDISAFFDNVSHDLLNLALDRHVREPWIRLLINRWLSAPIRQEDGTLRYRQGRGTPQGGVISPLLANLYLHYTLDVWMQQEFPEAKFTRYADDIIIQCDYKPRVKLIRRRLAERLEQCGLSLNEEKTNIAFCKSTGRKSEAPNVTFTFLGYRFQPMKAFSKTRQRMMTVFDCAISPKSEKKINDNLRSSKFHLWYAATIEQIADLLNPRLRGWINYYGKFHPQRLRRIMRKLNDRIAKWLCRKYKRFKKSERRAHRFLRNLAKERPTLFYHWERGYYQA